MRLLFVADGRSPTVINWLRHWVERGDEVYLASTYPCRMGLRLAGFEQVPVAFSSAARPPAIGRGSPLFGSQTLGLRTWLRQFLGPLTIQRSARKLRAWIEAVRPDLVHAMRIPFEGMLAGSTGSAVPLLVSVWGNDFTLHAPASPLMGWYTRRTLQNARGLHSDCQRDLRLARQWGYAMDRPSLVVPGNGGVRTEIFHPPVQAPQMPVVVNPRGFRSYVRNDTFFQAIPRVLEQMPGAIFRCAAMAGDYRAEDWLKRLGIGQAVELMAPVAHDRMAGIFQAAQVIVSPSTHDGTPNSLLEGMACGCFPVASALESIQEWLRDGENGLLVDPASPEDLAQGILTALGDPGLRRAALKQNARLIAERAEYRRCMTEAEAFYLELISG